MKNFFSQTWVVAGLVCVVLGVVVYIAFKNKDNETKKEEVNAEITKAA